MSERTLIAAFEAAYARFLKAAKAVDANGAAVEAGEQGPDDFAAGRALDELELSAVEFGRAWDLLLGGVHLITRLRGSHSALRAPGPNEVN